MKNNVNCYALIFGGIISAELDFLRGSQTVEEFYRIPGALAFSLLGGPVFTLGVWFTLFKMARLHPDAMQNFRSLAVLPPHIRWSLVFVFGTTALILLESAIYGALFRNEFGASPPPLLRMYIGIVALFLHSSAIYLIAATCWALLGPTRKS